LVNPVIAIILAVTAVLAFGEYVLWQVLFYNPLIN